MTKALPVYVLMAPFPFVLIIMSGIGLGGVQSQRRHTESTVIKTKITLHKSCHLKLVAKYMKQKKLNKSTNKDGEFSTGSVAFAASRPKRL